MIIESLLLIIGGYLFGSISASYLAGKWVKKIDLRQYGTIKRGAK